MKQVINIGATANDGTGTPLRNAFDMVNDDFTELYDKIGPCMGSKYLEFQNAIKYIQVNRMESGDLFYVGKIVNGTGSTPNLTYTIEIWKTSNYSSAGSKVMEYTYTGVALTGLSQVAIPESGGSGRYCWFGINWSLLITAGFPIGSTFTCVNFAEGGLFAINVMPQPGTPGGGGGAAIDSQIEEVTDASSVLSGDKLLYILNPVAPITVYLDLYASLKGSVEVSNISAYTVTILPDATQSAKTFNGGAVGIEIHAGENLKLMPYDGNFIITSGVYHSI